MARVERGINAALRHLQRAQDKGEELKMQTALNHGLWLGLGYCIARGWAFYKGDDCFKISREGISEWASRRRQAIAADHE